MFCTNCGTKLSEGVKFCHECGNATPQPSSPEKVEEAPPVINIPFIPPEAPDEPAESKSEFNIPDYQPQPAYTPPPEQPPAYSPGAEQPVAQYQPTNTYQQSYDQKYQKPKTKNTGLIIAFSVIGVAVVVIAVLMITGVFSSIGSPKGYKTPEELMSVYFGAFEEADEETIVSLLLPELVEYALDNGYVRKGLASEMDDYYDMYGNKISRWYVEDDYPYSIYEDEFEEIGLDGSTVEEYTNYSTEVKLGGPDDYDSYIFDFDLVKVSGKWYLIEVW